MFKCTYWCRSTLFTKLSILLLPPPTLTTVEYFKGSGGAGLTGYRHNLSFKMNYICLVFHDKNGQFKCILKSFHLKTLQKLYQLNLALIYNDFNFTYLSIVDPKNPLYCVQTKIYTLYNFLTRNYNRFRII